MALIKCNECAREVSDTAEVCPQCGFRLKKATTVRPATSNTAMGCLWLFVLICLFILVSHCTDDSDVAPAAVSASPEKKWRKTHTQGMLHFVLIDKAAELDEEQYRDAAASVCGVQDICHVYFWTDPSMVPKSLPMTDAQLNAQVASWARNSNTGLREWSWRCEVIKKRDGCLDTL